MGGWKMPEKHLKRGKYPEYIKNSNSRARK
jgi:hypothetical protein